MFLSLGIPTTRSVSEEGVTHLVLAQQQPGSTDESTRRALSFATSKGLHICTWSFVNALQKAADPPSSSSSPSPPLPPRSTSMDEAAYAEKCMRIRLEHHAGTDERWWGFAPLEKDWDANWPDERTYMPDGVAALAGAGDEDEEEEEEEVVLVEDLPGNASGERQPSEGQREGSSRQLTAPSEPEAVVDQAVGASSFFHPFCFLPFTNDFTTFLVPPEQQEQIVVVQSDQRLSQPEEPLLATQPVTAESQSQPSTSTSTSGPKKKVRAN
jgi:hypothetical protein